MKDGWKIYNNIMLQLAALQAAGSACGAVDGGINRSIGQLTV
jgi:hypothetical protein